MREKTSDVWLKAATAGSLWASVEIVVGSFLHNLRVPFAGTILAVMGISLMIAFQYKWKDQGLIWRSGMICAIMKSLSPSAVILGPMIGILTEAFLLDFFIRLLGRNPLGFILGSVAAVLSALIHKVFTIILLYGFNIVQILENMYQYAQKQLKVTGPEPITLLVYLVTLYLIFGILAAIIGMHAGKKLGEQKQNLILDLSTTGNKDLMIPGKNQYSLGLLFLHVIALTAGLYFVNSLNLYLSFPIILPYLIFVVIKYHKALRRFARPLFWIQLALILLFAVIFWNEFSIGSFFDSEGLTVGLKMVFRAVIVIMVFSAISVELRNPVVKTVLYRKGFSRFYSSLSLSFSVLPGVIARLAKPGNMILRPVTFLSETILYAEDIFKDFKEQIKKRQPVYIIAGDQREGKTTFLKEVTIKLTTRGTPVEGIMAEGLDKDGERTGFQLVNISNDKSIVLCSVHPKPDWEKTGKYYFNPEGLEFGRKVLNQISADSIVIIDEIGPLEMKGGGWSAPVQKILENYDNTMIWVVRRSLTEQIIHKFELKNVFILDVSRFTPEELVHWIPERN
jgi:nucleoside-triphosphatase THEP1